MTGGDNGPSGSSSYVWAGADQNELVSTTRSSTTSYVYVLPDDNGVPTIQSFTKNGQRTYIDTDPTGSPIEVQGPSGTDYYTLDNQGTPVGLINAAGAVSATYTYDPAGKQLTATGTSATTNPYRYTQGLLDQATGWIKHGLRWQDTTTANWTSQDPLSLLLQPDAAGRYSYVAGNPGNQLDPTGQGCAGDVAGYATSAFSIVGVAEAGEAASAAAVGASVGIGVSVLLGGVAAVGLVAVVVAAC